jgi:predicted permease
MAPRAGDQADQVNYNFVGPRFFETLRIPIVEGRDLTLDDDERSRPAAVVSESLAARYFPGQRAVGAHLQAGSDIVEIVGVVKDVPYAGLRAPKERVLYRPYLQRSTGVGQRFAVRTELPPAATVEQIRRTLREIAPEVPIGAVTMLDAHVDGVMASERLLATISAFFGLMALLLVAIGVYGALEYSVAQRTRELGIRLALGAARGEVMRMILGGALAPVCLGLVIGAPLALLSTQITRSLLFGITPREPMTYATTIVVLLCAAVMAAVVPAARAVRADPIVALREP